MRSIKILMIAVITILSTSAFAQTKAKNTMKMQNPTMNSVKYTCPMHPEITSNKPGKCSKCGMSLTASKKEQMKMEVMKIYTCPMHPDLTNDKPGKCSKCGMDLVEKKKSH